MTTTKRILTVCAALMISSGILAAPASAMTSMQMHKHQKMMMHKSKMMHHKRMMMHHKRMMHGNM